MSMLLNGGGIGQIQDITQALATALAGRENDLRSLIRQLDKFVANLNDQISDIIAATDSLNKLVAQVADQKPVLDKAKLKTDLTRYRCSETSGTTWADALDTLGKFSAVAADSVNQTNDSLVKEVNELGPVLQSLADSGPSLTRSLSLLATFPWVKENVANWLPGRLGKT